MACLLPDQLRVDTLAILASRLGFALRKAYPGLSSGDKELFLGPIADVLEDLATFLRPKGMLPADVSNLTSTRRRQLDLFTALASRSRTFGWKPPDIDINIDRIAMHMSKVNVLEDSFDLAPDSSSTCIDDLSFSESSSAVTFEDGPIARAFNLVMDLWPQHVCALSVAFARLAASMTAALALQPLPPRPAAASSVSADAALALAVLAGPLLALWRRRFALALARLPAASGRCT